MAPNPWNREQTLTKTFNSLMEVEGEVRTLSKQLDEKNDRLTTLRKRMASLLEVQPSQLPARKKPGPKPKAKVEEVKALPPAKKKTKRTKKRAKKAAKREASPPPRLLESIQAAMKGKKKPMSPTEVYAELNKRGLVPESTNPVAYINSTLASHSKPGDVFERVERGQYKLAQASATN